MRTYLFLCFSLFSHDKSKLLAFAFTSWEAKRYTSLTRQWKKWPKNHCISVLWFSLPLVPNCLEVRMQEDKDAGFPTPRYQLPHLCPQSSSDTEDSNSLVGPWTDVKKESVTENNLYPGMAIYLLSNLHNFESEGKKVLLIIMARQV